MLIFPGTYASLDVDTRTAHEQLQCRLMCSSRMEVLTGRGGRQQDEGGAADSDFPERRGYVQVSWTVSLFTAGHSFYMYEEYLWSGTI